MALTLDQIKTQFLDITNQESDSIYSDSYITNLANDVQREIADSWKWSFLQSKYFFTTVSPSTTSSAVATTDTEITVGDTTNYSSSGYLYIEGDVIQYTGKTATQFTGVTDISQSHASGTEVEQVYAKPTDLRREPKLMVRYASDELREFIYVDDYDHTAEIYKWTFVTDENGNEYIRQSDDNNENAIMYYQKDTTDMSDSADTISLPDAFGYFCMCKLMAGRAMAERDDDVDGLAQLNEAQGRRRLLQLKKQYGSDREGFGKIIRNSYKSQPFRGKRTYRSGRSYR